MIAVSLTAQQSLDITKAIINAEKAIEQIIGMPVTLQATTHVFSSQDNDVNLDEIMNLVAREFKISTSEMMCAKRDRYLSDARCIFWVISRNVLHATYEKLGSVSNRNHTTIIHGINKIEGLINTDTALREKYLKLSSLAMNITRY